MNKIHLFKPYIGEEEIQAVSEVLRSGWIGLGPKVEEFENEFASYLTTPDSITKPKVIGLNSATAALDMALKLLGIRSGDEVIVPTMTFVSTAHVVVYNQAKPIFVDVDPKTLNLDFNDVARKITRNTRAIIPVHLTGRPVDITGLRHFLWDKIGASNIPVIEDCAHACGSTYVSDNLVGSTYEQKCGIFGDMAAFSFHAVKNLTMGDGGVLVVNNNNKRFNANLLSERAKRLRWLGIDKSTWDRSKIEEQYWWEYLVDEIGLKCHMNDIMAAIGLVQLKKLEKMNRRRANIAELYDEGFMNIDWIERPSPDTWFTKSAWHIYMIKIKEGINRNKLSKYLEDKGISTGVHYKPIHLYNCYGNKPSLPIAENIYKRILSLPMHPGLTDKEVDYVIDCVKNFV